MSPRSKNSRYNENEKTAIKNMFLIGICGAGMSSLAAMLKDRGYHVTGSDTAFYPPASDLLSKHKISLLNGWNPENITPDIDLVVIGNVCRKDNPEVLKTHDLQLPFISLPDAVRDFFIRDREAIVISGTHGKTTTTALIAWILEKAGKNPSFMLGGVPLDFANSFKLTDSRYFVVEGDEYDSAYFQKDPKFLHYRPQHVLITSLEFDHADIYPDPEAYRDAFSKLLEILPPHGTLIASADYPQIDTVLASSRSAIRYSVKDLTREWHVKNVRSAFDCTAFDVFHRGEPYMAVSSRLVGGFNIANTLGAIAMAHSFGIEKQQIKNAVETFSGIKRRQEYVGDINGARVIDDFAHHPTAVRGILLAFSAIREREKVWAIFEPRSATARRRIHESEMEDALSLADIVIMPDPPDRGDIPGSELFRTGAVIQNLRKRGVDAYHIIRTPDIAMKIRRDAGESDIIVIMSNGDSGDLLRKLF